MEALGFIDDPSNFSPDETLPPRDPSCGPLCPPPCGDDVECTHRFYPLRWQRKQELYYSKQLSKEEAREKIQSYLTQAQANRRFLQERIKIYGDKIMNRWKKKSKEKRADILLSCEPELAKDPWHIMKHITDLTPDKEAREYPQKRYLLPFLSVDRLKSNPAAFLALLHNRTVYSLED